MEFLTKHTLHWHLLKILSFTAVLYQNNSASPICLIFSCLKYLLDWLHLCPSVTNEFACFSYQASPILVNCWQWFCSPPITIHPDKCHNETLQHCFKMLKDKVTGHQFSDTTQVSHFLITSSLTSTAYLTFTRYLPQDFAYLAESKLETINWSRINTIVNSTGYSIYSLFSM